MVIHFQGVGPVVVALSLRVNPELIAVEHLLYFSGGSPHFMKYRTSKNDIPFTTVDSRLRCTAWLFFSLSAIMIKL